MLSTSMITLTCGRHRSFDLWFTHVGTVQELQSLIKDPGYLQADCIIQYPGLLQGISLQPLSAALLCFSPASLLLDIRYIDASTDWPDLIAKSTAEAERGYVHLLVRPSLIAEFGIRVQDTNLHIHEAGTLYLPDQALWPKAGNPATGEQLLSAILQQQDGEGLRSHYPYAYVWYHNLLYLVTKISIPGFAASRACDAQVFDTCIRLRESGYRPFQVEAIYPRPFLSSIYKTTAQHTWFGIRLAQNFCQYRHQMGRLANGGR